jgi:hypothetical protein
VALVEEHVRDVMIAGVNDQPLDPADCPIRCVDVLAAAHLHLAHGNAVRGACGRTGLHADPHPALMPPPMPSP